jgi:hypothetical protein
MANPTLNDADLLAQSYRDEQIQSLRQTITDAPHPDSVATSNRIAPQLGLPPSQLDNIHDQAQTAIRAQNMAAVAQAHPTIGTWAAANPRQAVAASDDHKSLGMLGQAWDSIKNAAGSLFTSTAAVNPLVLGGALLSSIERATGYAPGDLTKAIQAPVDKTVGGIVGGVASVDRMIARRTGIGDPQSVDQDLADASAQFKAAGTSIAASQQAHGNLSSVLGLAGGVLPYAATGGLAPLAMGASGADEQADAAAKAGKSGTAASDAGIIANAAYQATVGHVFGLLGKYGAPMVGDAVAGAVGRSMARTSGGSLTGNILGQAATEGSGKLADYATRMIGSAGLGAGMSVGSNLITQQTINPKQSIMDGAGESAMSMVALDMLTHGLHAALGGHDAAQGDPTANLTQTGRAILPGITRALGGLHDASILDAMDRAASDSKFKTRDPDGYTALVKFLADQHGVDNVYVSPDAIRAYQQSGGYDRFNDPFQAHEDAIQEAQATGGEVALPAEFVMGDLAGTGAYKAIKDSVRLRPDGMTGAEAKDTLNKIDQVAKDTFDKLNEQDRAGQKEQDARADLTKQAQEKFQNAGFTPHVSSIYAQLVAQRYSTRAERLGKTLEPGDFDTRIVRVLPPSLEAARKADNLDLAINAMRKGKPAETQGGKSLLQFIADRGGINDSGGDLKAMGADAWHREQPGRKKLIRDEAKVDPMRAAGDDLRRMIENEGRDPSGMSDKEIRKFVEEKAKEPMPGGRSLDQVAYHGSPHIFDRFSLEHIGEGEGNQAYGYGLYFAGKKAIAEHYRKMLAGKPQYTADDYKEYFKPGRIIDGYSGKDKVVAFHEGAKNEPWNWSVDVQRVDANGEPAQGERVRNHTTRPTDREMHKVLGHAPTVAPGRLYHVDIPDDHEFLNWDKHVAGRDRDIFIKAFDMLGSDNWRAKDMADALKSNNDITGGEAYKMLVKAIGASRSKLDGIVSDPFGRTDQIASELLHNDGIAGVKYLDGSSRDNGEGSHNYVVFDDSRVSIKSYEQSKVGDDTPRGQIKMPVDGWGSGPATIELFAKANLSTLPHELGHQWLEELRFDAQHPDASQSLKDDWATVQKWFKDNGHPVEGDTIPTDAHELFARGIERYLMEGKAPTKAMDGIFSKIRGWMINIYKTVKALGAPITPEIRQVFDRLIATDDEINAKESGLAIKSGFDDLAKIGMSEAEAKAYTDLTNSARDEANSDLLAKTMATIRRQHTTAWNEERNGVRAEEAARLEETPLLSAIRLMKENPVDREWIVDRMGEDAPGLLPKSNRALVRDGGAHPDDIAEMAGYSSGEEMLHALMGAEKASRDAKASGDNRTLRNRLIDQATDAEMARRHGDDPFSDGAIENEAIQAVNEKMGGKLLDAQLKFLGAKSGNVAALYSIARTWAREKVRSGVIASEAMASAVQRHTRAVAKAGREAEKAILAGKWDEAFKAKQRQMLASALLAEAQDAHTEVNKAADALAKIAKRKTMASVDQDYLDQAHALLDDVQLGPRSQKSIDRQGKWADWAAARAAEGFDVVVPASFEATLKGEHWTRQTVENFLALKDAVDQVMHLGKLKQSLLDNQEQRTWDSIYREAENAAGHIDGPPPKSMADLHSPGALDMVKHGLASADAQLLRMETVFDWLDGHDPNGVFNRIAFKPIAEAQAREHVMMKDYIDGVRERMEAVPAEDRARWDDRLTTPWTDTRINEPMVLTRQQAIAMALNVGNEGNLQRLTDGYHLNEGAVQQWLNDTLSPGEWQFVQSIWDHIGTLWPQIEALEKRVNGVAPDKVEPRSFDTPHGTMRGGYYPAIYDSKIDTRSEANAGKAGDLLEAKYTRATTRASATKERSDQVTAPILLDLGVINRHLAEVIHDITHREAVMQAWRFLGSERVQNAVKTAFGPEYAKQFQPWVKSVANSMAMDRAGNEGFGAFLRRARMNVTMVGLGLRATTMFVHTTGLAAGAQVIGEKAMAHGLAVMARNPSAAIKTVLDASAEVRSYLEHYERDIGTMIDSMDSKPATKAKQLIHDGQKFALYGIGWMVQRTSVPVWIGAYDKAISEGMAHEDAIFAADKAVRYSLGAAAPKDLAAVQRSSGKWGEAIKMLTMFYTSMGSQYQRQRTLARDVGGSDSRSVRDPAKLASRAFWGVAMVPLWDAVIRMAIGGQGPDKNEWWSTWLANKMVSNMLAPIPGIRDLIEPALNKVEGHYSRNPSITPLQGIYDSVSKSLDDAGAIIHGKPTKSLTKDTLSTAGYITGLVPGQVASAAQYLVDVGNGSAHPDSVKDWINGLSLGHEVKHPR